MRLLTSKLFQCAVILFLVGGLSCLASFAQGPAAPAMDSASSEPAPPPALPDAPSSAASTDSGWRGAVSLYGWFPGAHGVIGAHYYWTGVHAPFSDVFSYLHGAVPIAGEIDKGRWVIPVDFVWVRLEDSKSIAGFNTGQDSVDATFTQTVFTPKIGYRVVDRDHVKVDALAGIRYWHIGYGFNLQPSGVGVSQSQSWVDGIGGARFIFPITEKASILLSGDAGAGGAESDYQGVGLFNYKFSRHIGAGIGWRYLHGEYFNWGTYPTGSGFSYDMSLTGALAGLFFEFGGKPPVPPASTCSISPAEVMAGEPVKASITTQNFNPKHKVTYSWSAPGAKIAGTGETGTVDTTGLAPGRYAITATATDPKEKKNNSTSCTTNFVVKEPPKPPVASCSIAPTTVKAGDNATFTVTASSPDGAALTYAYATTAGTISGTGNTAVLDTDGAPAGSPITVTATVKDSRGLTVTCPATVNVLAPPIVVQEASEIAECKFTDPKKPWRVDNTCKAILDDVALRIQHEPNGKFVVVGYSDEEEVVKFKEAGAQRAVNVKYYLVQGEGNARIDAGRLEARKGTVKEKSVKIYFLPSGATFKEESVVVDEAQTQGQPRNAPHTKKKSKAASKTAAPGN